jgi:hypothetical protein
MQKEGILEAMLATLLLLVPFLFFYLGSTQGQKVDYVRIGIAMVQHGEISPSLQVCKPNRFPAFQDSKHDEPIQQEHL